MGERKSVAERGNLNERDVNLDFIRVLAMIFTVAIHIQPYPWGEAGALWNCIMTALLLSCNSFFYMLSGQLNLSQTFSEKKDYYRFYIKKAISILFPYAIYTCVLSLVHLVGAGQPVTILSYLKNFYVEFMQSNASIYLWFLYPLVGMLLSTPFLSKMLAAMNDSEVKILFGVALIWNVVSIYLTADVGVSFQFSAWIFSGWIISFFAGYFVDRIVNDQNKKNLYLLGSVGFLVTVLGSWLIPEHYGNATSLAPAFVLFTMAAYVFLKKEIPIRNRAMKKFLRFASKHSFMEYLVHVHVYTHFTLKIMKVTPDSSVPAYVLALVLTVVISLFVAFLLDICLIQPLQKLLKKMFLRY